MDNQTSSEPTALDINGGAAAFASLLSPEQKDEEAKAAVTEQPEEQPETPEAEPQDAEAAVEEPPKVTVKVDGKDIELTPEQIAEAVKGQMRQEDYTKKTMALAEQRKAAESEVQKARDERTKYAQTLQEQEILLSNALKEQENIDWNRLLESDPVEYLKQQHLYQQRQAALQKTQLEAQNTRQLHQAEEQKAHQNYLAEQQDELLAKLPEWKDAEKAKAGKAQLRDYLMKQGLTEQEISGISNHRAVLMSYKAMQYDQMIEKANAAAKKVSTLPQRVEKPGVSDTRGIDKRSTAFNQLSKTGRVEDAAKVFAQFL